MVNGAGCINQDLRENFGHNFAGSFVLGLTWISFSFFRREHLYNRPNFHLFPNTYTHIITTHMGFGSGLILTGFGFNLSKRMNFS